MKLLHFADLHIGVENYGRVDPQTGLSTRLLDFLATFDELVDFAIAQQVDAVLFAGDAYKSRDPSQTHQREFARRIARLTSAGIPVFLVAGNHDLPAIAGRATALEIFPTLAIERVFVADRIATTLIPTRASPLQVVSLPWVRRAAFLAREETRTMTLDQIKQLLQDRLTLLLAQEFQRLDPSLPAVLVGHVHVLGARVGTERSMVLGDDPVLMPSNLAHPALDYVALGHIHKHQVLYTNPPIVYAGSLQRVDFSEEGEDKGFCVVDLDAARPAGQRLSTFTFHRVQARPFLTIDVPVDPGREDPTQAVLDTIARRHVEGSIVRVLVHMSEEQEPRLRHAAIREALAAFAAHHVASIQHEVDRSRRTRLSPEASRSLAPLDALRLYLESRNTEPARMELLLRHARSLLQEEMGDAQPEEESS
ncbi:MAG: exonuclease SbcCD subunit D [Chloroflexi bacterium]|nr:exonuclease SbcCD subunit D [Chloroflexota bacterium]